MRQFSLRKKSEDALGRNQLHLEPLIDIFWHKTELQQQVETFGLPCRDCLETLIRIGVLRALETTQPLTEVLSKRVKLYDLIMQ